MREKALFSLLFLAGVFMSSLAQLQLKKSADKNHATFAKEYLNLRVTVAYAIFVVATLCSVFSYKVIPLSWGPILGASEYPFVALLSRRFLGERIGGRRALGMVTIVVGIVVFTL